MAEEVKVRKPRRRRWFGVAAGVLLLVAAVASLVWYLRSARFEDLVRRKVVASLEKATGGQVELTSFHWNLSQLAFEAQGLTIHGLEPAGQQPFLRADRLLVRLRIVSLVERQVSLEQLDVRHPVIHIIVNRDGSTNAPEPRIKSRKTAVQELFDLAISRADVRQGMLVLNERRLPLDFAANDVVAGMSYDAGDRRYDGRLQAGKIDIQYGDFRDIPAQAELQFSLWRNTAQIRTLRLASE
ncbi:MAG TPA: hypothetical protein VL240_02450, partial [Candidatus Binatia bacterium]|nr:hypothetical protein [Candidatus Binatia bacterium]